jgi:hypothetical protein
MKDLPADQRAGPGDAEVLVFLKLAEKWDRVPFSEPDRMRIDQPVAVVAMPGPRPVGVFTVRGVEWPAERMRKSGGPPIPNSGKDLSQWVIQFMKSPKQFVGK